MVILNNKQVRKKDEFRYILKANITILIIEEMFRVQKYEFGLEEIRVLSLSSLNRLFLLLSIIITFMSLKVEKKNGFFHAVIKRAKGIKGTDQIRMFLYRFSAGMKAILEKDSKGIQHFKYIERPKNPRQLELKLAL